MNSPELGSDSATDLIIRHAIQSDARKLALFGAKTFTDTFGPDNKPEDMAMFLASTFSTEHQAREIADPGYVTLLAVIAGSIAGYAQLRWSEAPECVTGPSPIELLRFYVDAVWKGRGIAQRLMTEVRETAKSLGAQTLWLGVWEHNPRARAFYAKSGYQDIGSHDFVLGTDTQTDRIMAVSLV